MSLVVPWLAKSPLSWLNGLMNVPSDGNGPAGNASAGFVSMLTPLSNPGPLRIDARSEGGRSAWTEAAERAKIERLLRSALVELAEAAYQEHRLVRGQADWVDRPVALARRDRPSEVYWNTSHSDPGLSVPATIDTVRVRPALVSVMADPGVRVAASEPPTPGVPPDVTVYAPSGVNSWA